MRMQESAKSTTKVTLIAAEPQLLVIDIDAACDFYTKRLGFDVAFTYGEPPFYGQVFRDGARLNFRQVDRPALFAVPGKEERLLSATITVDDAELLFLEFDAAGVEFAETLKTEAWGARTFMIRDPDGNLVLFAGSAG